MRQVSLGTKLYRYVFTLYGQSEYSEYEGGIGGTICISVYPWKIASLLVG